MNEQWVELVIEESSVRSYAMYVERAKRRAEQALADYQEAQDAYKQMVKVLRNKLENYYNG